VAVFNLWRLGRSTGNNELESMAEQTAGVFAKRLKAYPAAYTQFLVALDFFMSEKGS
jgi:uncharacterized protein YyaL (SSP411 family)